MVNSIRSELRKALTNKMLYISVAIGLLFCVLDVVENVEKIQGFNERLLSSIELDIPRKRCGHFGYSLFYLWMGLYPNTRGSSLFYTVWPVLAAMAYGWSYINERRSGVYDQIASRTSAKTYFVSKYIAVFVSGGIAVGLPVLLNLLANALVCPFSPIPVVYGPVNNGSFMSETYYTHPWIYGLTWCGMTFLCGGVAACLCFVVGTKMRHGVMVMLTPYALYVGLDAIINNLKATALKDVDLMLSPLRLTNSTPGMSNPEWFVFSILGLLTLFSFGVGYWQVVKHELA